MLGDKLLESLERILQAKEDKLNDKNRFENTDVNIQHGGTKIILPDDPHQMTTGEAITALTRLQRAEETPVTVHEEVEAFPLDGAHAMSMALREIYGWVEAVPKPGMFGPVPPKVINLEIGFGKQTQVIWGMFRVPNVSGALETGMTRKEGRLIFCIEGTVLKKEQAVVKRIADRTREIARAHSIYKGKAIRVRTDGNQIDAQNQPRFLDTSRVDERELVFSDELMTQVTTNLFTPIEKTDLCRKNRVPLKRGVLLEGPYGTGKTLTAFVTAKKCEANGWTFIMLDRVAALKDALIFARMYAPAVIFAEDIDRTIEGERSVQMDDVLNTIDGADSKGTEVITILTSNHVDKINRAMLRPGRLDAVLSIQAPDAKAAERLMRLYARGLIPTGADLTQAGKELAGQIPAVIREVVERSKLYAISRLKSDREGFELQGHDLETAARGMKTHLALLNPPKTADKTASERLGDALGEVVIKAFMSEAGVEDAMTNALDEVKSSVESVGSDLNDAQADIERIKRAVTRAG
jgi:transitional endoplasmic reticulum ATPase